MSFVAITEIIIFKAEPFRMRLQTKQNLWLLPEKNKFFSEK